MEETANNFTAHDIYEFENERLHDQKCAEDDLNNVLNEIKNLVANSNVDKIQFQDLYEKARMYLLIIGLERKSLQGLHSIL